MEAGITGAAIALEAHEGKSLFPQKHRCAPPYNIRILEKHSRESGQPIDSTLINHPREGEVIESLILRGIKVFEHVEQLEQTAA